MGNQIALDKTRQQQKINPAHSRSNINGVIMGHNRGLIYSNNIVVLIWKWNKSGIFSCTLCFVVIFISLLTDFSFVSWFLIFLTLLVVSHFQFAVNRAIFSRGGGGGYSRQFRIGVCREGS